MAKFTRITKDHVFPYSSENAAASFYAWLISLFRHDNGYEIVFDQEIANPEVRMQLPFPCFVVNQIDTTDPNNGYFGGEIDRNNVAFYVYCYANRSQHGTPRLVRRMKDQLLFALKNAGKWSDSDNDVIIPPINMKNFALSGNPELESALTLANSVLQNFTEDGEILRYELMLILNYVERN